MVSSDGASADGKGTPVRKVARSVIPRRLIAWLTAIAVFIVSVLAAAAAAPYALGLLEGCFPPVGSCGDGVGWALIISSPISVPTALIISAILAALAFAAGMRPGRAT